MAPARLALASRAAAIALAAMVFVVLPGLLAAGAVASLARHEAATEALRQRITDYRRAATRLKALEPGGGDAAATRLLVHRDIEAERVASDLEARMREAVLGSGGALRAVDFRRPESKGTLTRIGLRLTAQGTLLTLTEVLRAVETAMPLVFVHDLQISALQGPSPLDPNQPPPALRIEIDLYSYLEETR